MNFFKPRYKICYQTKNKVFLYKNSKFRGFFKVRSRQIFKTNNKFYRRMFCNMKWTGMKRFLVPRQRRSDRFNFYYANMFRHKQQIKNFYGKMSETELRKNFQIFWKDQMFYKNEIFAGSLEKRLDMVLFRMRLFPTIFSCHQYISHNGVLVNNKNISLPSYKINIGDIVGIEPSHWSIFYKNLTKKLKNRTNAIIGYRFQKYRYRIKRNRKIFGRNKRIRKYTFQRTRSIQFYDKLFRELFSKLEFLIKNHSLNKTPLTKWSVQIYLYSLYTFEQLFEMSDALNKIHFKRLQKRYCIFDAVGANFIGSLYFYLFFINYLIKVNKKIGINTKNAQRYEGTFWNTFDFNQAKNNYISLFNKKSKELILQRSIEQSMYIRPTLIEKFNKKRTRGIVKRQQFNKWWYGGSHFFIPNYLEYDMRTLRIGFIRNPKPEEIIYPFKNSLNKLISFYLSRGY